MKPLDCVGTTGNIGKHDFQPSGEIVHGSVQVPAASELAAVIRERDALAVVLKLLIAAKDEKEARGETPLYQELKRGLWDRARHTLAKLASGELRKSS
jgi:hypothetical protein